MKRLLVLMLLVLLLSACGDVQIAQVELSPAPVASPSLERGLAEYWYGYWYMKDCTGDWYEMEGMWWDCCGQVTREGDRLHLLLWDEDLDKSYYLALMELILSDKGLTLTGGDFMELPLAFDGAELALAQDGMLTIQGLWQDEYEGDFSYTFCLRPWGDEWPEGDRRPFYYEDWYLPLIEAGQAPPDRIDVGQYGS